MIACITCFVVQTTPTPKFEIFESSFSIRLLSPSTTPPLVLSRIQLKSLRAKAALIAMPALQEGVIARCGPVRWVCNAIYHHTY